MRRRTIDERSSSSKPGQLDGPSHSIRRPCCEITVGFLNSHKGSLYLRRIRPHALSFWLYHVSVLLVLHMYHPRCFPPGGKSRKRRSFLVPESGALHAYDMIAPPLKTPVQSQDKISLLYRPVEIGLDMALIRLCHQRAFMMFDSPFNFYFYWGYQVDTLSFYPSIW